MKYQLATIVVTSAVAANLRELALRMDKGDMGGMFVVGLSATGNAPATHFISSGCVPKVLIRALRDPVLMFSAARVAWDGDGDVLPFTQAQVTNALSKCELVSAASNSEGALPEAPEATLLRLGLKAVVTPPPSI